MTKDRRGASRITGTPAHETQSYDRANLPTRSVPTKSGRENAPRRNSTQNHVATSRRASPTKQKNRRGRRVVRLLLVILAALFVFSLFQLSSNHFFSGKKNDTSDQDAAATSLVTTPDETEATIDSSLPLSGKIVIIDPGHGGQDAGCAYPTNNPDIRECDVNLDIAQYAKTELENLGATVYLLRTDDSWLSLYSRISLTHLYCMNYAESIGLDEISDSDISYLTDSLNDVIDINSDTVESGGMGIMSGTGVGSSLEMLMNLEYQLDNILFISIHVDSNPESSLHGTQVYYVTDDSVNASEDQLIIDDPSYADNEDFAVREDYYGRDNDRNAALAQQIYSSIVAQVPDLETNTPETVADNYAVLREQGLTSILIETAFITNSSDRELLSDSVIKQEIALGIANGCASFYAAES